jgi:cyclopropane fatty-acyl-phospholipid synthase-like methyltransferase
MSKIFDGIFSLDILEHIEKSDEDKFMRNTLDSLSKNGVCIGGMQSLESQVYASEISKKQVNCKSGNEFKSFMKKYFDRVMMFLMNDEFIHTGYMPMSQNLLAVCMYPKIEE